MFYVIYGYIDLYWMDMRGERVGNWSVGHNGIQEYRVTWGSGLHEYQQAERNDPNTPRETHRWGTHRLRDVYD